MFNTAHCGIVRQGTHILDRIALEYAKTAGNGSKAPPLPVLKYGADVAKKLAGVLEAGSVARVCKVLVPAAELSNANPAVGTRHPPPRISTRILG